MAMKSVAVREGTWGRLPCPGCNVVCFEVNLTLSELIAVGVFNTETRQLLRHSRGCTYRPGSKKFSLSIVIVRTWPKLANIFRSQEALAYESLFAEVANIVRNINIRGDRRKIEESLTKVSNDFWMAEWLLPGVGKPEWYKRVVVLRDGLVYMLNQHIMEIPTHFGYRGNLDFRLVSDGTIPLHLKTWDSEWLLVIQPKITLLKGFFE
jgi:hypothetical protein